MLPFVLLLTFLSSVTASTAIHFSSIQQCGPFNVTLSGAQPTSSPLFLTVVPFGSSAVPLSIPLPNPDWNSETNTGVAITFLPYPAGTTFIASLNDAQGRGIGFTSDVIKILQSDNTSCISTVEQTQTYTAQPPFFQCQSFIVAFDPTQAAPPAVHLLVPNGQSLLLNQTQESTDPGTSDFTMVAFRGQPVVLLFRDGSGRLQSTDLLTVMGDVTSSNSCFPKLPNDAAPKMSQQAGLSRQAVIGIVASIASVVTLLTIIIAVYYFLRYRRNGQIQRATQQTAIEGGPGPAEPGAPPPLVPQTSQSWNPISLINKTVPYPMEKYTSRSPSPYLVQPMPNYYNLDSDKQMQSLNAATADLDQILKASVFASGSGNRTWSTSLSPSTPLSRDVQNTEPFGIEEQLRGAIPESPSTSNFRDSIIPTSYIQMRSAEADVGTGGGKGGGAARRSSTTVVISRQDAANQGGRDYRGDPYF